MAACGTVYRKLRLMPDWLVHTPITPIRRKI